VVPGFAEHEIETMPQDAATGGTIQAWFASSPI
jgi:hypothetical protein